MDLTNITMENKQAWTDKIYELEASISGGGGGGTASLDYREYVGYVIIGGGGPVVTVAKNDLGFTPIFTKQNPGEYTISATGGFPDFEKVFPTFNPQQGSPTFWNVFWNDANSLGVNTWNVSGTLSDLFVGNISIKIYD